MTNKKIKFFKILFLMSFTIWDSSGHSLESDPSSYLGVAAKIAKEKGVQILKETLQWTMDKKDIPKDWLTIKNSFFSVSYPKCFSLEPDGSESDNVKFSPGIIFNRSKECPGYVKENERINRFVIGLYGGGISVESLTNTPGENPLVRQNVNLNGMQAYSLINFIDMWDGGTQEKGIMLRWNVYVTCKKRLLELGFDAPIGEFSKKMIDKGNYEFPEDFKKIASTFKCGKK